MERRFANTISYLFHPLLLPFYTIGLLLWTDPALEGVAPVTSRLILLGIFFFIAILLPLFFSMILYRMKIVSSLYMEKQEERIYPLLVTGIFYYLAYYLMKEIRISPAIGLFMLGSTLLVTAVLILTFYRKISLHMTGIGGVAGWMLGFPGHFGAMPWLFYGTIFIAGIVGMARLVLGAHRSLDVYLGFLLGMMGMFSVSLFG